VITSEEAGPGASGIYLPDLIDVFGLVWTATSKTWYLAALIEVERLLFEAG
jgi:hypothetical protein